MNFKFGPFTLDARARQLCRGADPVHLSPKAFDLLALLVRRRPEARRKSLVVLGVTAGALRGRSAGRSEGPGRAPSATVRPQVRVATVADMAIGLGSCALVLREVGRCARSGECPRWIRVIWEARERRFGHRAPPMAEPFEERVIRAIRLALRVAGRIWRA